MVRRLLSFWDGNFSGAMLSFQGVLGFVQGDFLTDSSLRDEIQPEKTTICYQKMFWVTFFPFASQSRESKLGSVLNPDPNMMAFFPILDTTCGPNRLSPQLHFEAQSLSLSWKNV